MENEISQPYDWMGMLFNWVFFFGLVMAILFPALKFQKIARQYGKNVWVYFFAGLGVGLVGLQLGRLLIYWLRSALIGKDYAIFGVFIMFIPPILLYLIFYKLLKKKIAN